LLKLWLSEYNQLSRAYGNLWLDLKAEAELLGIKIEDGEYTTASIKRSQQYKDFIRKTAAAIGGYQLLVVASSRDLQQGAIDRSYANLERLVGLQDNSLGFRKVEKGALEVLISYLEPGSPLYNRINGLSDYGADLVSQAIIDSIRKGHNATETARTIRKAFGAPLSESLRMTRTATAWSYREANRLQYMTNPQAVEGWIWYSALDPGRTCMSCVNLHGTFHSAAEVQNDHHNGLCTSIPKVIGFDNLVDEMGADWFNQQPESVQRQMMGHSKYEAWKDGKISIGDMTKTYQDEVYGEMTREASLKDLIGD
jgi:hypothetical protein